MFNSCGPSSAGARARVSLVLQSLLLVEVDGDFFWQQKLVLIFLLPVAPPHLTDKSWLLGFLPLLEGGRAPW